MGNCDNRSCGFVGMCGFGIVQVQIECKEEGNSLEDGEVLSKHEYVLSQLFWRIAGLVVCLGAILGLNGEAVLAICECNRDVINKYLKGFLLNN